MITRNRFIGIIVLLAGLTAGYFASRTLSSVYGYSKDHFMEAVNQGADAKLKALDGNLRPGERELDLLRLLDYYRRFFLHFYHWMDTGDMQSATQYKLALGQFTASLDYLEEKYAADPFFGEVQMDEFHRIIRIAEQSGRSIRWAKVVVVVLIFLFLMGIPGLIRDSGYKKYAATLYYDSLFRPRFISDLKSWHSTRRTAFGLVFMYLFGMFILSSFSSWIFPLVFGSLGLLPVVFILALSGSVRRMPEKVISLISPKILIEILLLVFVAVRGPVFFLYRFWTSETFSLFFLSILGMLIFRRFHVYSILIRQWSHRNRWASSAVAGMALGLQVLTAGVLLYFFGVSESLAALNQEVLILPGDFFADLNLEVFWPMLAAGILSAGSFILFLFNRKGGSELSI